MPMQVFMHGPVPFSAVFIEVCGVPKVLVELSVGEASHLSVKVETELEDKEEHRVVESHYGHVPTREDVERASQAFGVDRIEQANERGEHVQDDFVDNEL